MGFKIPSFSLHVEGAEGREKQLENDDLLPVPAEQRCVNDDVEWTAGLTRLQNVELLDLYHLLVQCGWDSVQLARRRDVFDGECGLAANPGGVLTRGDQYGLTVWDGLLCNTFGYLIISFFMVINGRAGSVYHVSTTSRGRSLMLIRSRSDFQYTVDQRLECTGPCGQSSTGLSRPSW